MPLNTMMPREFLRAYSLGITHLMRDANRLSAPTFIKRYRTGPREARAMVLRIREIYSAPEKQEEAAMLVRRLACAVLDEGPNNAPILDAAARESNQPEL